jgi:hypothetical protein
MATHIAIENVSLLDLPHQPRDAYQASGVAALAREQGFEVVTTGNPHAVALAGVHPDRGQFAVKYIDGKLIWAWTSPGHSKSKTWVGVRALRAWLNGAGS